MADFIKSGIRSVRSTTSVPHFTNAIHTRPTLVGRFASRNLSPPATRRSRRDRHPAVLRRGSNRDRLLLSFRDAACRGVLVDCGLFQGPKTLKALNYGAFPFRPADIDAVLLTHAHIDHSGLLPKLVREGFARTDFRNARNHRSVLLHAARRRRHTGKRGRDSQSTQRRTRSRLRSTPIYTKADAFASLESFQAVEYEQWIEVQPDIRARYWNAGHLLGSASIELEFANEVEAGQPLRILVSGDIGPDAKLLEASPEAPTGFDYVISESTYGERERPSITPQSRRETLAAEVRPGACGRRRPAHPGLCSRAYPGADRRSGRSDAAGRNSNSADLSRFAAGYPRHGGFPPSTPANSAQMSTLRPFSGPRICDSQRLQPRARRSKAFRLSHHHRGERHV